MYGMEHNGTQWNTTAAKQSITKGILIEEEVLGEKCLMSMFAGRLQDGTAKFCSMRTWHSRPRPVWPTASGSWPGASPATTASTEAKSAFSEAVPEEFCVFLHKLHV